MKRLRFLFMTVVCTVLFSCGEDDGTQNHSVTAFAGYGGAAVTVDREKAMVGETVTIMATPNDGFLFKEWKVRVGNAVIENVQATTSTFTMPMEDVVIVATFMIRNDVLERITDPVLKAYCQSRMDTEQEIDGIVYPKWDKNNNGVLSPDEAIEIKAIDVTGGMNGAKVKSVDGLLEFLSLEILNISGNELTALDLKWTNLTKLDCSNNKLSDLSIGGIKKLKKLYCNSNHLSSLNLKTMLYGDGYMLCCGNQTAEDGEPQAIEVLLSGEQFAFWESDLKDLDENANVVAEIAPEVDIYLTMTKVTKFPLGTLMVTFSDTSNNSIQLYLESLSNLLPGEYSKDQLNNSMNNVRIQSAGGKRALDSDDPGSFTVEYDEASGIYTVRGVLNLKPNVSYPDLNVVGFEYVGSI